MLYYILNTTSDYPLLSTIKFPSPNCHLLAISAPPAKRGTSQGPLLSVRITKCEWHARCFCFFLPPYTQSINRACTRARGWSPDWRHISTRHRMRYMNRHAVFVAVAAGTIVAACEEVNRSSRVDDAAYCITSWLYLPVSSRSRMPSVKMTIFGFRMKMVMGKRYTRPFLLLGCHFLNSESVLELLPFSTTSKGPIRKSLLYTRFTRPKLRIYLSSENIRV